MNAFDVIGDPARRRILELLADGERPAGSLAAVIQQDFGISQPAASQHLRVLRENGFVTVRPDGARRLYSIDTTPLREVDGWLSRYRALWDERFDRLDEHLARIQQSPPPTPDPDPDPDRS